jgi:circadian clock protein KaiB
MSRPAVFKFRLFIADHTQNSAQAMLNLRRLCNQHLTGRHSIEVVDVLRYPERALAAGVFMTPTLVKLAPGADVRIVGTLSQTPTVLAALGLEDCTV